MDDINMIPNKEQIVNDLPAEETEAVKKCRNNKVVRILICSILLLMLVTIVGAWALLGAPIYDFGLGNWEMTGASYGSGGNIYSMDTASYAFLPSILVNERREFIIAQSDTDGTYYQKTVCKPRIRVALTQFNFDNLIAGAEWRCVLSDGDTLNAKYIRNHYSAAWLVLLDDSPNGRFRIFILMDDGNIMIAIGSFARIMDGKYCPTSITRIGYLRRYGDAQDFYEYLGGK